MRTSALATWHRTYSLMTRTHYGVLTLAVMALLLWFVAVGQAVYADMGLLGLVTLLGWPYFVGLALVALGFANELLRTPMRPRWLLVFVILMVLYLFGTACAIEPIAPLADAYRHSGILQYFFQHGHALPHYEADFSWPGSFSLGAVFVGFAGQANSLGFTRYFPLFIELMYLAPLLVISRSVGVGRRASWLGVALFYTSDWIYQDYFSPQALGYLFLLITLAAVLATWHPKPSPKPPLSGFLRTIRFRYVRVRAVFRLSRLEGHDTVSVWSNSQTLGVVGLLGLISLAMAISHELTPYALVLLLLGCLVTRRLGRPELLIASALFVVGWLSLGASDYWIGHLGYIFSGFLNFGQTLSSNVTGRVSGSAAHQYAVETRILVIGGLYVLAGIGVLRRSAETRVLEVLAVAPFLLLAIQSYVGEGLMRMVFYTLPYTAFLAASAVLPQRSGQFRSILPTFRPGRYGRVTLWALVFFIILGSTFATTVARGGNDAFESFSVGELDAVNYVYTHAQTSNTIAMVSPYMPFNQAEVGSLNWDSWETAGYITVKQLRKDLTKLHPQFILLSQSQENWGEIVVGLPRGWENKLFISLVSTGYHVAASWPTATVLVPNLKVTPKNSTTAVP
ncbi:MAG TPA: hypothetical protein VMU68_10505 [Acidimicrobiales bacterium]|nr:hypothetical protein [Acidimicrobiales bacterium]